MIEKAPITRVIKKVLPTVVSITVSKYLGFIEKQPSSSFFPFEGLEESFSIPKKKKVNIGGGSGFIVDPSGIILTNRHVVSDPRAEYVVILNENKQYEAKVLAKDPINDVAIIKIVEKHLPVAILGNSSNLDLGETAVAIGNTLGLFQNTVSIGVISGLSRQITAIDALDGNTQNLRGLIQTDAAINPGNSGGPLVNAKGEVIGINSAMVFGAENVGFALPINAAKKSLEDVKKYGRIRQPFLGVRYILLTKELQEKYNLPLSGGALVVVEPASSPFEKSKVAVAPGSPADKANIKEGDIILEIEGKKISFDNPLEAILYKLNVNQEAKLKIFRKGKEIILKIKLEEKQ